MGASAEDLATEALKETLTTATPSAAIRRVLPWLVAVAFFMESLDTTILNTAVPIVAKSIGTTPLAMSSSEPSMRCVSPGPTGSSTSAAAPARRFGVRRRWCNALPVSIYPRR